MVKTRSRSKSRRSSSGKRRKELASLADRHDLYQKSVQAPDVDSEFLVEYFEGYTGTPLRRFREDFCGTAILSCHFVKRHPENTALCVDLDGPTLDWGREHNVEGLLDEDERRRIRLVEADVMAVGEPKVQLVAALNFSYSIFKERDTLREYFRHAFESLEPGGLLMLDMWGGSETQVLQEEEREIENDDEPIGDFVYVWDQDRFDPSTYHGLNRIHFRFRDGSEMRDAFLYEWRMWTMPEVMEVLREAGFEDVHFLWEGTDPETGEGDDEYIRRESAEPDDAWIAYVVGARPGAGRNGHG